MSSPTLDLLCCSFVRIVNETVNATDVQNDAITVNGSDTNHSNVHPSSATPFKTYLYLYNATVIVMSSLSIIGALYMLYPKRQESQNSSRSLTRVVDKRQKWILFWLSFSDIMACFGLIVLASDFLRVLDASDENLMVELSEGAWEWVCIIATAWTHFFFFATYMWLTSYAVDVYLFLRKSTLTDVFKVYFVISWFFPILFIIFGLWALYETAEPQLACSAKSSKHNLVVIYYLCLFIPMVAVLIINPIIYIMAGRRVSPLMKAGGMYTDKEREIERQVKKKFLKIVITLVICWLPNVVNGIMLLSGVPLSSKIYYIIWILMAIMNPLQAFLNTLVYWGPTGCSGFSLLHKTPEEEEDTVSDYLHSHPPWRDAAVPSDTEHTPLVRGRAKDTLN
ncbi:G-protein coupled receptor 143-like [Diadema setosum]|uniref:G-protein coupled receptor 143-like n=1 Tax=Diadema setosum TaxID=31175 RepID=UPI003B3A3E70